MSNYQIHIEQTKYETFFHFLEISFLIIHFSPFTAWGLGKVIKVPEVAGKVKNKNHYRHICMYLHWTKNKSNLLLNHKKALIFII